VDLGRFQFGKLYTQCVGPLGWGISPPQGHYLHRTTQTQNKRTQTSIPRVEFEPTVPASEPAKTVHALDHSAAVTVYNVLYYYNNKNKELLQETKHGKLI
jgi:hypothetical protein